MLHRSREDAGVVDLVVAARERDHVVGPEQAQHLDLLLVPAGPVAEPGAERLVLHCVPPDPDAEPEPAARQHVDLGRLLGDERGLALREHQHARHEFELGDRGEEPEQHEDLVERGLGVVRTAPVGPPSQAGAEDVVVGHQEREAARFCCPHEVDDVARIVTDLGLGEGHADLHRHARRPPTRIATSSSVTRSTPVLRTTSGREP